MLWPAGKAHSRWVCRFRSWVGGRGVEMEERGGIGTGTHVRLDVRVVERQSALHNYPPQSSVHLNM